MNKWQRLAAGLLVVVGCATGPGRAASGPTVGVAGGRVYVVAQGHPRVSDDNPGTEQKPLKTIQAAADRAMPGDTVLVKPGIYREQVIPRRGGTSADRPIIYKADGPGVSIRGSEPVSGWQNLGGGLWVVEVDTAMFKGYNPFAMPVWGSWLGRGRDRRLGQVYLDGKPLLEVMSLEQVKSRPDTWYVDPRYGYVNRTEFPAERRYPNNKMKIWANFGQVDPNKALTEINARRACIFPDKPYLRHIVIDGFDIRHAAPQWSDIYWTEYGAIGTRYGYGWTIQNCTIADSRNVGISLGVTDLVHFPRRDEGGLLEGGSNIPPMDKIGHHRIRNNFITRCGQTGIYGCYGAVGCLIENNVITETVYHNQWAGSNQAAIKILFPIDTVIRDNLILAAKDGGGRNAKGIWLDWGAQNARVTGNVICDFGSNRGLFLEVDFGPVVVDHNVIVRSDVVIESDGVVLAHNLFDDCRFLFMASPQRTVPYFKPHSTERAGRASPMLRHNRIYNNLFVGPGGLGREGLVRGNADVSGIDCDENVYLGGARPFPGKDANSLVDDRSPVQLSVQADRDGARMTLVLPAGALQGRHRLVTSRRVGKVPLAEMFMEHPDGRPLDLDRDFFGRPIDPAKVLPGPFQNLRPGCNRLVIWPKPAGGPAGR